VLHAEVLKKAQITAGYWTKKQMNYNNYRLGVQ
jgi:hypothetical protein